MKKLLNWIGEAVDKLLLGYMTKTGLVLWDGGGSAPAPATPTQQTVTQTSIPEYAQPYVETLMGKAQTLTGTPYQQYGGERIAGFSPLQQQAFQNIQGMGVSPQTGQATGLAGLAGLGGLGAGGAYTQMATDPSQIRKYMSPYIQGALEPQLDEMRRQYGINAQNLQGQATVQGAFGGNRAALQQAENARNMNMAMNQAIGQGYQNAFNAAQQAQQFGANLGLGGLGLAGQAAGQLGQLGQQQYGQQMGINAAQQQAGAQQQALQQQGLTQAYQDFLNQQKYPYQQLGFMSDILRGMPLTGTSTQSMYQAPPSMLSQTSGLLGGLGSLGAAMYRGS